MAMAESNRKSVDRLAIIQRDMKKDSAGSVDDNVLMKVPIPIHKKKQELLTEKGEWGLIDSGFVAVQKGADQNPKQEITFTGSRYELGNGLELPYFNEWVSNNLGIEPSNPKCPNPELAKFPSPIIIEGFVQDLKSIPITHSFEGMDRLFRAHGYTLHDVTQLRSGTFPQIPDVVVWPESHDHVVQLFSIASKHNVAVVLVGSDINVTGALERSAEEKRMIVSLDTSHMNHFQSIDEDDLVARVEAGIIGRDLETRLQQRGFTTGQEPDSYEFSSLGGWVVTRASGLKKTHCGKIDDNLIGLQAVIANEEMLTSGTYPRVSTGPDMNHVMLGSKGSLVVLSEVAIKIRPMPPVRKFASFVFPDMACGIKFMSRIARERCQPASLRLIDNEQFNFGQALHPSKGPFGLLMAGVKSIYLTRMKGLDSTKICVAAMVIEGSLQEVAIQEKKLNAISISCQGIPAGEHNGKRGYQLTFAIAYIKDIGLDYGVVAESFETSVRLNCVVNVVNNTKNRLTLECIARKFSHYFISARVTQVNDGEVAVYFYFGFNYGTMGILEAVRVFEELEKIARVEILASGGSLSDHHGGGKIRQQWLPAVLISKAVQGLPLTIFQLSDIVENSLSMEFGTHLKYEMTKKPRVLVNAAHNVMKIVPLD